MVRFVFFRLQPIEIIKPFFLLITAGLISSSKEKKFQLFLFPKLTNSYSDNNITFKSTRYWPINFTYNDLVIYCVYFRNKNKLYFALVWFINYLFDRNFINIS